MEKWLQFALAVPLSGGVLGLLYRIAPVPRWTWAMKNRLTVYKDMPDGPERDWWAAEATRYSAMIREYTQYFPRSQKVLGWFVVVYALVLLYLDLFLPWHKAMNLDLYGVFGPVITLVTLANWVWMCVSVLRGRTVFGLTSQEHALVVEQTKIKLARTRLVRFVRGRIRRAASA